MKKTLWMAMVLAVSATIGCSITEERSVLIDPNKKVSFSTSIVTSPIETGELVTKAPSLSDNGTGNFTNGDLFTLQTSTASGSTANLEYRVGFSNLYWKDIVRTPQDQTVNFAACYPKQSLNNGKIAFDLETAQDKDLLWARMNDVPLMTETPIDLTFHHAMHRLVITYEIVSGLSAGEAIQTVCTAKSTCQIDLASATIDNSATRKASFSAEGNSAVFLLVPQQTSDVTLRINLGQNTQEFPLNELVSNFSALESGKQLNVNLTVKDGTIQMDGSSIAGWGDQGTVEGEIII